MPHIALSMYLGRDSETKRDIAKKMRQCYVETFGVDQEAVSVSISKSRSKNSARPFSNAIDPRNSTFPPRQSAAQTTTGDSETVATYGAGVSSQ